MQDFFNDILVQRLSNSRLNSEMALLIIIKKCVNEFLMKKYIRTLLFFFFHV